jgi:hypothetical protein
VRSSRRCSALSPRRCWSAAAPSWVAALGAIAWWFVLEFAIRTVVDEVRAFYGRFCVRSSGMDQRELHRESCQWRKGSGGAILGE